MMEPEKEKDPPSLVSVGRAYALIAIAFAIATWLGTVDIGGRSIPPLHTHVLLTNAMLSAAYTFATFFIVTVIVWLAKGDKK